MIISIGYHSNLEIIYTYLKCSETNSIHTYRALFYDEGCKPAIEFKTKDPAPGSFFFIRADGSSINMPLYKMPMEPISNLHWSFQVYDITHSQASQVGLIQRFIYRRN